MRRRTTGAEPPVQVPQNAARSQWQISRVNAVLGRGEAALYHAERCFELCTENAIGDWDLASAYEALARAHKLAGERRRIPPQSRARTRSACADRERGGSRAHRGRPRRVGLGGCAVRDRCAELLERRRVWLLVLLQRLVGSRELLVRHRLLQALDHATALAFGRVRLRPALADELVDRLLRVASSPPPPQAARPTTAKETASPLRKQALEALGVFERPDHREVQCVPADHVLCETRFRS